MKPIFYLFLISILTSCAAIHNVPDSQRPNNFIQPNTTSSFVDQNGNFYPDSWLKEFGKPPRNASRNDYSLMKIATEKSFQDELINYENLRLKAISERIRNKKRVIIFVHGIDNDYLSSLSSYNKAKSYMNINNSNDEILNFYWDGLVNESLFGAAKVWVSATTNSQLAGVFGLRRILNSISNKDVYLISHSRGASVVLSALVNPSLKSSEIKRAKKVHHVDYSDALELKENNNRFYSIMLAPAIGRVDFVTDADELKQFTPQLKKMHITINNTDYVLGKGRVGFLSRSFTPTDFGYKDDLYNELNKTYTFLEKTDFTGQDSHEFKKYINNPKFITILKEFKLSK
ncbi:alpha/beta hydrolase [Chishuiella sp.]|uniref:alpha/beta hydrolase n=1 Tax=Chishuiella sp. TaxID=1969467 RepID=UPI0028AACCDD|nr:alpha/beta hydrolase [Chishuiella sp.]